MSSEKFLTDVLPVVVLMAVIFGGKLLWGKRLQKKLKEQGPPRFSLEQFIGGKNPRAFRKQRKVYRWLLVMGVAIVGIFAFLITQSHKEDPALYFVPVSIAATLGLVAALIEWQTRNQERLFREGRRLKAKVLKVGIFTDKNGNGSVQVEYALNAQNFQPSLSVQQPSKRFVVGQELEIFVNPDKPKKGLIFDEFESRLWEYRPD